MHREEDPVRRVSTCSSPIILSGAKSKHFAGVMPRRAPVADATRRVVEERDLFRAQETRSFANPRVFVQRLKILLLISIVSSSDRFS